MTARWSEYRPEEDDEEAQFHEGAKLSIRSPFIAVSHTGVFSFNAEAWQMLGLARRIVIGYAPSRHLIRFRPANKFDFLETRALRPLYIKVHGKDGYGRVRHPARFWATELAKQIWRPPDGESWSMVPVIDELEPSALIIGPWFPYNIEGTVRVMRWKDENGRRTKPQYMGWR